MFPSSCLLNEIQRVIYSVVYDNVLCGSKRSGFHGCACQSKESATKNLTLWLGSGTPSEYKIFNEGKFSITISQQSTFIFAIMSARKK